MADTERIQKFNAALTQTGGNRALAAELLGVSKMTVREVIRENPDLKAVWGVKSRKVIHLSQPNGDVVTVSLTEEQIAEQQERQFEKLIAPIMGDSKEMSDNLSLAKAYGKHSELCESVIGGNVFERTLKLKKLADAVDKELKLSLAEAPAVELEARIEDNYKLRALMEFSVNIHKQLIASADMINRGRVANAKVRALKEAAKGSKIGKTSFGPKRSQTNIVANNVQLNAPA